jgi:hypothetical protein
MKMFNGLPSLEQFLEMEDDRVAALVSSSNIGQAGVLVPDGNRKAGLVLWGFDPSKKDFDRDLFSKIHRKFLEVVRIFFNIGVKALFIPLLMHKNFDRGREYMEAAMEEGLRNIFRDPCWLTFYDTNNLKVRFYGDRKFIEEKGYSNLLEWMTELEERTAINNGGTLFLGVACNRSLEEVRLASIGIEFHNRTGKIPTKSDLANAYYGGDVPEIGFFIRPTEVRDSDVQPILISGPKTQMYFPICPVAFLTKKVIRSLFYDLLISRVASGGKKMYSKEDIDGTDMMRVKEYYRLNSTVILGTGLREGPFWLPNSVIRLHYDKDGEDMDNHEETE